MAWKDFNLFDFEREGFSHTFDEIVLPILDASEQRFNQREQEIDSEYDAALLEESNEAERRDARGWAAYKQTMLDEQREVIGAALLNVLCLAMKDSLESMSRYFKASHPAEDKYPGKSWLDKKQAEFKGRFQIDFQDAKEFSRVRELVLARNASVHQNEGTLNEYREKVSEPRFLSDDGFLTFEKGPLVESFVDSNKFVEWVWCELDRIRIKSIPN